MPGIYDEPEFYVAACAYRDVPSEVTALLRWWGQHSTLDGAGRGAQPEARNVYGSTVLGQALWSVVHADAGID